jgi:hypothetical protein
LAPTGPPKNGCYFVNTAGNASLTKALKTATTSFPNPAATSGCYSLGKDQGEVVMFSVVRIIVVLACAYAGSAVAERQIADPADLVLMVQP